MSELFKAIQQNRDSILKEWLDGIRAASIRRDLIDDRELEVQTSEVMGAIVDAPSGTTLEGPQRSWVASPEGTSGQPFGFSCHPWIYSIGDRAFRAFP